jgi:glycine/D-amino acid oxidase-like deaminating enzyme
MREADVLVVGGGVVGLAMAWGLSRRGLRVTVIDAGRPQPRASTANFGLVWLQSKGDGFAAYGAWTRQAVDAWPAFAAELREASGIDTAFQATGGLGYCLGEAEWQARAARVMRMRAAHAADVYGTVMLDRAELQRKMPGLTLGAEVMGASWNPHEGTVDPLKLVHGLRLALQRAGVTVLHGAPVQALTPSRVGFELQAAGLSHRAPHLVLAAGLGNEQLAPMLGIDAHVHADRGQILVTERVPWRLPLPANGLRQTPDGTVMIGATREGPDADLQCTDPVRAAGMAQRAVRILPALARARITRVWAGLRTLSADSAPVYARSSRWPGAVSVNCHSGITLAPLHAGAVAAWAAGVGGDACVAPLTPGRFDVPQAA